MLEEAACSARFRSEMLRGSSADRLHREPWRTSARISTFTISKESLGLLMGSYKAGSEGCKTGKAHKTSLLLSNDCRAAIKSAEGLQGGHKVC